MLRDKRGSIGMKCDNGFTCVQLGKDIMQAGIAQIYSQRMGRQCKTVSMQHIHSVFNFCNGIGNLRHRQ
ncbi:hypothetical protein D3C73_1341260 [compost metagenome]